MTFCGDIFEYDGCGGVDVDKVKVVELLEVLGWLVPELQNVTNFTSTQIVYPNR